MKTKDKERRDELLRLAQQRPLTREEILELLRLDKFVERDQKEHD